MRTHTHTLREKQRNAFANLIKRAPTEGHRETLVRHSDTPHNTCKPTSCKDLNERKRQQDKDGDNDRDRQTSLSDKAPFRLPSVAGLMGHG